jgi:hypothetical protein
MTRATQTLCHFKKARPGQRRHSGPRCLSPDTGGGTHPRRTRRHSSAARLRHCAAAAVSPAAVPHADGRRHASPRHGRLSAGRQPIPGTRRYRHGSAQTGAATETALPKAAALEQEQDPGPVTAIRRHLLRSTVRTSRSKRPANPPPWRPRRHHGPCPAPDQSVRCTGNPPPPPSPGWHQSRMRT